MHLYILFFLIVFSITACSDNKGNNATNNKKVFTEKTQKDTALVVVDTLTKVERNEQPVIDSLEQVLINAGLVNIQDLDSTIRVELRYSSVHNFMKEDVYGGLERAYLQPEVAEKLTKAQLYLHQKDSSLQLLIYDAVRPRSVQQKMWDILDMPIQQKVKFVSNPNKGSVHNYGAAVDLTIMRKSGEVLDMGADFDQPDMIAWPAKESHFLKTGVLDSIQVSNRKLLREVMGKAGFFNIQTEWWHFNAYYRKTAQQKFKIIE